MKIKCANSNCSRLFTPDRKNQKYCSPDCRVAAHIERQRRKYQEKRDL